MIVFSPPPPANLGHDAHDDAAVGRSHSRYRRLVVSLVRMGLAAGLIYFLFFETVSPAVSGVFFLAYLSTGVIGYLDESRNGSVRVPNVTDTPVGMTVDAHRVGTQLVEAATYFDGMLQRYSSLMQEHQVLKQKHAKSAPNAVGSLPAFQQLLGAAVRNHPHLTEMVKSQAVEVLDQAGMRAISYGDEPSKDGFFDVQRDIENRMSSPVELYPAIVKQDGGHVVLRGRVILPAAN